MCYNPEDDDFGIEQHDACPYCFGGGILSQVREEGEEIGDPCPLCDGTGEDNKSLTPDPFEYDDAEFPIFIYARY